MESGNSTIREVWRDKRDLILFALIFFISLGVYWPALKAGFILDDYPVIVDNPLIRHFNLSDLWRFDPARFLTNLTFTLNFLIGGFAMEQWRLVNIFIHSINTLFVFKLIEITALTPLGKKSFSERSEPVLAYGGALLFCLHPVNTQAVHYLVQRSELLCTFFIIASLYFYVRGRLNEGVKDYWLSFLFVVLGLLTKPLMIVFPAILLVYDVFFFGTGREERFRPLVWGMIVLPLVAVPFWLLGPEHLKRLSIDGLAMMPYELRLFTQPRVIVTYLRLLFVPINLTFDYHYPLASGFGSGVHWISFITVSVLATGGWIFRNRFRLISFGIFWFLITLTPVVFFPLTDLIFEHWLYLPSIGIIVVLMDILIRAFSSQKLLYTVVGIWCVTFAVLTFQRTQVWSHPLRLMRDNVLKSPGDYRVHLNLGIQLLRSGYAMEAKSEFLEAIRLRPEDENGYVNLARLYIEFGDYESAVPYLKQAMIYNPSSFKAMFNLAQVYERSGDLKAALGLYHRVLQLKPDLSAVYLSIGNVYQELGGNYDAKKAFQRAIWLKPESALGYYNLGNLLFSERNFYEALGKYQKAVRLDPNLDQAFTNMGNIYQYFGDHKSAIENYQQAVKINPYSPEAYYNLANSLYAIDSKEEAESAIQISITNYRRAGNKATAARIERRIKKQNK